MISVNTVARSLYTGFIFILLSLCTIQAKGQFFIQLGDTAGKPVQDAQVSVIPMVSNNLDYTKAKSYYTNEKGTIESQVGGKCVLQVQAEGFVSVEDTVVLIKGATYRIKLLALVAEVTEVVVTGTPEPTTADRAVPKIIVIDQKRIEAQGAVNLKDVLSNQMNVRLKQDNILGSSLSLQGIGGQNVKILVDGVPLIGRMDGNIDLAQINLNNIERIEIVEGPMSVMYGTDALGGVINLITKKTNKHTVEGNVNTYYESVGNYNIDGRVAFKTPKNVNVQVSGGRNFFDGFGPIGPYGRVQQWKPKEQYFADAVVGFKIKNSNHRIQSVFFDELLLSRGEPTVRPYAIYAFDNYFYTRRFNNSLFSDFKLKNNAHVQIINSYSWFRRHNIQKRRDLLTVEDILTQGKTDHDTSVFDLIMSRGTYTQSIKKVILQAGYDINYETGRGRRIDGGSQSIGDFAVYATAEYRYRVLVVRPGIRASYNTRYGSPITPSFNAKYDFSKRLNVRVAYARGFRAPSLKELNLFFVDQNHNIRPNDNLKAEISDNVSMYWAYTPVSTKNIRLRIEPSVYYNDIRNMISLAVVDAATQLYNYVNIGRYSNAGANFNTDFSYKNIALQAGASFMAVKNEFTGASVSPYTTTEEYRGSITYTVPKAGTRISMFYKYNGKVPGYAVDGNNQVYQTYIQDYSMADMSVAQSFLGKRITVVLGSRNIFNVIRINYNAPTGGAHNGGGNSMSIGMGRTYFINVKIHIFKQEKE